MILLILELLAGVWGVDWFGRNVLCRLFPKLGRRLAAAISLSLLVLLICAQYFVVDYFPNAKRTLRPWQREALLEHCPAGLAVNELFLLGSAPGQLEADDFSKQLMAVFNTCHSRAAYGYDPFGNCIVVNGKMVIVQPDSDFLLRQDGIELWVLDPRHPSPADKAMADALSAACLPFTWQLDTRLKGTAVCGSYRLPIVGFKYVLFIGAKPALSLRELYLYEQCYTRFSSQHPPDANRVMYWAVCSYGTLVFVAPIVLLAIAVRRSIAGRFIAR